MDLRRSGLHLALALGLSVGLLARAEAPVEVQLAAQSLRSGEKARLEKVLGPLEKLPLYRVELEIDPKRHQVWGRESITLTAATELTHVFLRVTPNATDGEVVKISALEVDGVKRKIDTSEPALIPVELSPPLARGASLTLTLKFAAVLPVIQPGLSPGTGAKGGDYGAFSASADVIALAGVVPMVSPVNAAGEPLALPSGIGDLGTFEPSNFIVAISVPPGWQGLAPGVLTGEVPDASGKRRFTYALAGARELPVLAVKGYTSTTRQVGEVTVESWSSTKDAKSGAAALTHAAESLALLEAHFGPYPFKSLRVVEAHFRDGAGGMEFPGLVTVSATLYSGAANPLAALGVDLGTDQLMKSLLSDLGDLGGMMGRLFEATLEFTVEHELAHQYFAMLVGNDPVAEPVVDEPLTQHVALLLMEWRQGKKTADEMREAQLKASYQVMRMMGGADAPANRPTSAFSSNVDYAALIYGKAPLLFDIWRSKLGDERWLATLRTYVEENRYRWATSKTLLQLASRKNPHDAAALAALQRRWWEETHGDEDVGLAALAGPGTMGGGLGNLGGGATLSPEDLKALNRLLTGE